MVNAANLHYGNLYNTDKYSLSRYKKYARLLKYKFGGKKVRLLEIGCYTAKLAELLPKEVEYLGMDFDEKAIEIAMAKGFNVSKINFESRELGLKEKFDIIVAAEILEHLLDPAKMMMQIKNLLNDDGIVLLSLPNENTIYHRFMACLGLGIDLCAFQLYKYLHFPSIRQSIRFVNQHFKIIRKEYYVNPGAKGSRIEKFSLIFKLLPDFVWEWLAYLYPACFARGIIMIAVKK